jgi:quercetin dioxygenase-like cupin family protein
MEIKYNEATYNRPLGDRIIDAPIVVMDLEKYSQQLLEEDAWVKNGRNGITILKTSGLSIVLVWLHTDTELVENQIDGHVTIQVMEGAVECVIETGTIHLQKQQIISIHPDIVHSIRAIERSLLLITNKAEV